MVWCDNCLLIFPLRLGALVLATVILLYSVAGGVVLFMFGEFLWFQYPESQIYGGLAMAVGAVALLVILAMANRSYALTSILFIVYPFVLALLAVRLGLMVFRLNSYQDRIVWECANGRQLWNETIAAMVPVPPPAPDATLLPTCFCKFSWHSVYYGFTFALVIDLILNAYLYFMTWRFKARLLAFSPINMMLAGDYGANKA